MRQKDTTKRYEKETQMTQNPTSNLHQSATLHSIHYALSQRQIKQFEGLNFVQKVAARQSLGGIHIPPSPTLPANLQTNATNANTSNLHQQSSCQREVSESKSPRLFNTYHNQKRKSTATVSQQKAAQSPAAPQGTNSAAPLHTARINLDKMQHQQAVSGVTTEQQLVAIQTTTSASGDQSSAVKMQQAFTAKNTGTSLVPNNTSSLSQMNSQNSQQRRSSGVHKKGQKSNLGSLTTVGSSKPCQEQQHSAGSQGQNYQPKRAVKNNNLSQGSQNFGKSQQTLRSVKSQKFLNGSVQSSSKIASQQVNYGVPNQILIGNLQAKYSKPMGGQSHIFRDENRQNLGNMIENRNQIQMLTNHLQKLPLPSTFSNSSQLLPPKRVKQSLDQQSKHKKIAQKPPVFQKSQTKSQQKNAIVPNTIHNQQSSSAKEKQLNEDLTVHPQTQSITADSDPTPKDSATNGKIEESLTSKIIEKQSNQSIQTNQFNQIIKKQRQILKEQQIQEENEAKKINKQIQLPEKILAHEKIQGGLSPTRKQLQRQSELKNQNQNQIVNFLQTSIDLLRSEMLSEINSLKQRLSWLEKEKQELISKTNANNANDKNRQSPRGGYGSNYETNQLAQQMLKPKNHFEVNPNFMQNRLASLTAVPEQLNEQQQQMTVENQNAQNLEPLKRQQDQVQINGIVRPSKSLKSLADANRRSHEYLRVVHMQSESKKEKAFLGGERQTNSDREHEFGKNFHKRQILSQTQQNLRKALLEPAEDCDQMLKDNETFKFFKETKESGAQKGKCKLETEASPIKLADKSLEQRVKHGNMNIQDNNLERKVEEDISLSSVNSVGNEGQGAQKRFEIQTGEKSFFRDNRTLSAMSQFGDQICTDSFVVLAGGGQAGENDKSNQLSKLIERINMDSQNNYQRPTTQMLTQNRTESLHVQDNTTRNELFDRQQLFGGRTQRNESQQISKDCFEGNNLRKRNKEGNRLVNYDSAAASDGFMSDDCDEKRSYTPQPRQNSMFANYGPNVPKITSTNQGHQQIKAAYLDTYLNFNANGDGACREQAGQKTFEERKRSFSNISHVNNKSDLASNFSRLENVSANMSRNRGGFTVFADLQNRVQTERSQNQNQRDQQNVGLFQDEKIQASNLVRQTYQDNRSTTNMAQKVRSMADLQALKSTQNNGGQTRIREGGSIQPRGQSQILSFSALMELKGSKCKCLPQFFGHNNTSTNGPQRQQQSLQYSRTIDDKICGSYCKKVGPKQQKSIILNLLKHEKQKGKVQKKKRKKQFGGVLPQTSTNYDQIGGCSRYLINVKWWQLWCDYVNFDARLMINDDSLDEEYSSQNKETQEDNEQLSQNGVDNSDDNLRAKHHKRRCVGKNATDLLSSQYASSSKDISQHLYEKPARICNLSLLDSTVLKGQRQRLKPNLIEHYDFEVLYPSVWKHFYSWYSADVQIVRQMTKDALNDKQTMRLDLYPSTNDVANAGNYQALLFGADFDDSVTSQTAFQSTNHEHLDNEDRLKNQGKSNRKENPQSKNPYEDFKQQKTSVPSNSKNDQQLTQQNNNFGRRMTEYSAKGGESDSEQYQKDKNNLSQDHKQRLDFEYLDCEYDKNGDVNRRPLMEETVKQSLQDLTRVKRSQTPNH